MKTMKTLRYIIPFVAAALLLVMTYRFNAPLDSSPKQKRPPLRYGYSSFLGYCPFAIAQEKGFYAQQGVEVELVLEPDAYVMISDFLAGKTDGLTWTMDVVMRVLTNEPDVRVVLYSGETAGADLVMVRPEIKKISDLKGKKIATKTGSFSEMFVGEMLLQNGLSTDDVTLIDASEKDVPTHLEHDTVQAGHTWEPYVTAAMTKAGAKAIFSSKQTLGKFPDFMIFRGSILRDREKDVQAFIRAWFQAVEYWNAHPEEGNEIAEKVMKIPRHEIDRSTYQFYTAMDNQKAFAPGNELLASIAERYIKFLIQDGQLGYRPNVKKLFDPSLLPRATIPQ